MKKTLTLIFCTLVLITFKSKAQPYVWTQKANFAPGNRAGAFGFSIGTKGYVGSGVVQSGNQINYVNDFWEYDPAIDAWTQKAQLPGTSRSSAAAFATANKGYVTTGFTGSVYLNETLEYDPSANAWNAKSNFPGAARYTATAFIIGNFAYVGMGKGGPYYLDFFRYDPAADSWTPITSIGGTARQNAKSFSVGNYGYVIGGSNENVGDFFDVWQYDAAGNTWLQKSNFPGSGSYAGIAFAINGSGFAGAGGASVIDSTYQDFYSYNASTDTWTPVADFGGGKRIGLSFIAIGNNGYAGMGSSTINTLNYQDDWWEFSSTTGINMLNTSPGIKVSFTNHELSIQWNDFLTADAQLKIFNLRGELVREETMQKGNYLYRYELKNLSSAGYLYSITSPGKFPASGKLVMF